MSANVVVKTEPVEAIDIENKILELCEQNPVGVSDSLFQAAIPSSDATQRLPILQRLISQGKLEVLKKGKQHLFRLKDPAIANQGATAEEKLIYQRIAAAKNKGIWMKELRYQLDLPLPQVNKILKSLENKKLIKCVKPVNASKKKMYMLFELEPDSSITGGAWYSDTDFETEFVDVLNQQCYRFLLQAKPKAASLDPISYRNASYKSSKDVWKFITELKISKVELSVLDIEKILDTLIFDGKVDKTVVMARPNTTDNLYRAVNPMIESAPLMRMPCGVCTISDDCREGSIISPSTCKYMEEWLNF